MGQRVRVGKPKPRTRRRLYGGSGGGDEPLPLDPRDPDVVRVKEQQRKEEQR